MAEARGDGTGPHIGHVHLRVADLDRALAFYEGVLGLTLQVRMGDEAAFLGWDGYHHHIALNVWGSRGGTAPAAGPYRPVPISRSSIRTGRRWRVS